MLAPLLRVAFICSIWFSLSPATVDLAMLAAGQWLHMQEHMRTSALRRCVFLGHRSLLSTGHEGASRAQAAPQSLWYAGRRRRACRSEFVHTRTHTPLPTHTTPTRSLTAPKCPSRSYLLTIGLLAPRPPLPPRMRMYKCTHTHTQMRTDDGDRRGRANHECAARACFSSFQSAHRAGADDAGECHRRCRLHGRVTEQTLMDEGV